jgi:hypothetical protein
MSDAHNGSHGAHDGAHAHEHIHLPPPSISPLVVSLGLAVILLGLIFNVFILGIGVLILVGGLALWLAQDVHAFRLEDDWQ